MPQVSRRLLCRRKVLVAAGVAVAGVSVGFAPARAVARERAPGERAPGERARGGRAPLQVPAGAHFELLGASLASGTSLGHGVIEAVLPLTAGAVPVVMRTP